jgi:hypothetical protein
MRCCAPWFCQSNGLRPRSAPTAWLHGHPLSLRRVEDMVEECGIDICHETVRPWWNCVGQMKTLQKIQRRPRPFPQSLQPGSHLIRRDLFKTRRAAALAEWSAAREGVRSVETSSRRTDSTATHPSSSSCSACQFLSSRRLACFPHHPEPTGLGLQAFRAFDGHLLMHVSALFRPHSVSARMPVSPVTWNYDGSGRPPIHKSGRSCHGQCASFWPFVGSSAAKIAG